eukprot:scaffold5055_cov58-Phaeocystis_antarctica.AAC.6
MRSEGGAAGARPDPVRPDSAGAADPTSLDLAIDGHTPADITLALTRTLPNPALTLTPTLL